MCLLPRPLSLVCQEAGRQRGLLPGDFGNLRRASLTKQQIDSLLNLVMSSLSKIELSIASKKRSGMLWKPLDSNYRLHLELCARLMACAQRQFFVETEWNQIENHDNHLTKMVKESGRDKDEISELLHFDQQRKQLVDSSESPWMKNITTPILRVLPTRKSTTINSGNLLHINGHDVSKGSNQKTEMLLDRFESTDDIPYETDSKLVRPLVMLISACAEAFPAGSCWTCSARNNWQSIQPEDTLAENILHFQTCSSVDLALVVQLLARLLEACGGSTGDHELQMLAVLCLTRLTEVHTTALKFLRDTPEDLSELAAAWKLVWITLFRPDLRYSAYTANSAEGSCGELVLILLTELVQRGCTDPETELSQFSSKQSTFIYQQQEQAWTLPVFKIKGSSIKTPASFELIYALLHKVGLSDAGISLPLESMNESILDSTNHRTLGRRFQLLSYCLEALHSIQLSDLNTKQSVLSSASACIAALVHGRACSRNRTFMEHSRNPSWGRSSEPSEAQDRFNFTELPDATIYNVSMDSLDTDAGTFDLLWKSPIPDPGYSSLMRQRLIESVRTDYVLATKMKLFVIACPPDSASSHADFVADTTSGTLRSILQKQLLLIKQMSDESGMEEEEGLALDPQQKSRQFSLREQALWVKILLHTCTSCKKEHVMLALQFISDDVLSLLERISSTMPSLRGDIDEFKDVLTALLQILLALGRLSLIQRVNLPSAIIKAGASFLAVCESVLQGSLGTDNDDGQGAWDDPTHHESAEEEDGDYDEPKRSVLRDTRNDFSALDDSDDDDEAVNRRLAEQKRKREQEGSRGKRKRADSHRTQRKRAKSVNNRLDSDCAYLVSSIMILLEPSLEKCDAVVQHLLGNEDDYSDEEVDLRLAFYCCCLLSQKSVYFHDEAVRLLDGINAQDESFRQNSLVITFCKVLRSLRNSCSPSSTLHLFGFQKVAEIVEICESDARGMPLTADESKSLINILKPDDKSLQYRPYLRTDKLLGAIAAFGAGNQTFHNTFDSHFPKSFVIPSLRDLSAHVRKDACLAVAAALRVLPEPNRIVKSVLNCMPPIRGTAVENAPTFQDWYQHMDLGTQDLEVESQVWKDSAASMETCAIECRAVIAGVKPEFTKDILYEFVKMSTFRPELEAVCFRACDKIACMLGYTAAEDLIADESEGIIQRWIETEGSFDSIPLLLSSPSLIRQLLLAGKNHLLYTKKKEGSATDSEMALFDYGNLKAVAVDDFVAKYKSFIFPSILFEIVSKEKKSENSADERKKILLTHRLLQELCTCLKDSSDEDAMKLVFHSRRHDLEAFCGPMLHGGLEELANEMFKLSEAILGTPTDEVQTRPHVTIKRILDLSGKGPELYSSPVGQEAYSEAILTLLHKLGKSCKGDILSLAGTSSTESLLFARQWLENAKVSSRIEWRWLTIKLISEMIFAQIRRGDTNTQLGFCVNVMVDIILNPCLSCIHQHTFSALKDVLQEVLSNKEMLVLREEMIFVYRRLVGACMKAHEEAQRVFLEECSDIAKSNNETYVQSLGLLRGNEVDGMGITATDTSTDAWGWDANSDDSAGLSRIVLEFWKSVKKQTCDTLLGTYDLLETIFSNSSELGLNDDDYFVGAKPPFSVSRRQQEALSAADPRFCAQNLAVLFLEKRKQEQPQESSVSESSVTTILKLLHSSWMETFGSSQAARQTLSMSQWMLKAELIQLELALRRQRGSGRLSLPADMTECLIRELAFVCGAPCPNDLRLAASRCIGELDLVVAKELSAASNSGRPPEGNALGVRSIQTQCIQVLGEYLYTAKSDVAIASCTTLIALLACREGGECWDLLDNETKLLLRPLYDSKKRQPRDKKLPVSKAKLKAIKARAGVGTDSAEIDLSWCWAKDLWTNHSNFESWICSLVPALIECCYGDPGDKSKDKKGKGDFFRISQNISAFAPGFARSIFPAIVLDLLQRHEDAVNSPSNSSSGYSPVFLDTWLAGPTDLALIGFSKGFETLLSEVVASPENDGLGGKQHTLDLLLDTIDLLRRDSQQRFVLSESHRRNSNAIPNMSNNDTERKSGKKPSKSSRSQSPRNLQNAATYNQGLGEIPIWKGIPFGTVLRLDGHLVVRACLRLKRQASALFYMELFLDTCFRESGGIMEKLSSDFINGSLKARQCSSSDISGYHADAVAGCDVSIIRQRALDSLTLLGNCFMALHEDDAVQATQRQKSDLLYSGGNFVIGDEDVESMLPPSLAELQRLDTLASRTRPLARITDTMEELGLQNFLQTYIRGLNASEPSLTESDRLLLREKFFKSKLFGMEWLDLPTSINDRDVTNVSTALLSGSTELGECNLQPEKAGFYESISEALAAYTTNDLRSCQIALTNARASLLVPIASMATEANLVGLSDMVERLQSLNDLEQLSRGVSPDMLLNRWGFFFNGDDAEGSGVVSGVSKGCVDHDLRLNTSCTPGGLMSLVIEIVLRISNFKSKEGPVMGKFEPRQCLESLLYKVSSGCRTMKLHSIAEAALFRLRTLLKSDNLSSETAFLHQASLMESKGDFTGAIRVTKQIISRLSASSGRAHVDAEGLLVDTMVQCGHWMSKYKVAPAKQILYSYHKPSAEKAKEIYDFHQSEKNGERYLKAMLALAQLASNLYESVSARIKSIDWIKAGQRLAERESELEDSEQLLLEATKRVGKKRSGGSQRESHQKLVDEHRDLRIYTIGLRKEVQLCSEEREKTENSVKVHLKLALKSYLSALSLSGVGEGVDMSRQVFRMVHLWLTTCSEGRGDSEINTIMNEGIPNIPSFRFVPLTSQLFAQIENDQHSSFQVTLQQLVYRMCHQHPYHCIASLLSMANGKEVGGGVSGRNATAFLENVSDSKVEAAKALISALKSEGDGYIGKLIENYQSLMTAYIALAMSPTEELVRHRKTKQISFNTVSTKSSHRLDKVLSKRTECPPCVLTKPPNLRPGCDYGDGSVDPIGGERVMRFENEYSITDSGLHRPKIVICVGSQGTRFRQLVKGEDELRQDAVMEQVFVYVNDLFRRRGQGDYGEVESSGATRSSSSQELRMQTYNIVPLSPASGVLEWVEDTMTFGDYLLDTRDDKRGHKLGAHSRYYPGEWGSGRCREHYKNSPKEVMRESYDVICKVHFT